jgi:hypothetical protein
MLAASVAGAVGPVEYTWRAVSLLDGAPDAAVDGNRSASVTSSPFDALDRVYRVSATDMGVSPPVTITADRVLRAATAWSMGPASGAIPSYPGTDFEVSIPQPANASCSVMLEQASGASLADADVILASAFLQATQTWTEVARDSRCRFVSSDDIRGHQGIFRLVFTAQDAASSARAHYIVTFKRSY